MIVWEENKTLNKFIQNENTNKYEVSKHALLPNGGNKPTNGASISDAEDS